MKILGYNYTFDMTRSHHDIGAMGRCNSETLLIQVADSMSVQQQESTAIHEIIEAINFHLQLEMPHPTISALEASLYAALKDNGVDLSPLLNGDAEDAHSH
jgi:hypothetical protein